MLFTKTLIFILNIYASTVGKNAKWALVVCLAQIDSDKQDHQSKKLAFVRAWV